MILSETPRIEFLRMDCMELMRNTPDKFYDLAIVDPPYGINGDNAIQKQNGKCGFAKHKNTSWDKEAPPSEYFNELFRVSENQIIWGGNYFTNFLPPKMCWLSWDKAQTTFSFSDFELAWTSFDTKCKKFELIRGFDEKGKHYSIDNSRIHPTQKPSALYKWLLTNYAKPGDKILDTHAGSFSSGIACYRMGFDMTACEIDQEYYDAAVKRFKLNTAQTTIF